MKICEFNQRVQGFCKKYSYNTDGELKAVIEPADWFWAKITPLQYSLKLGKNQEMPEAIHYEIVMLNKHNRYTRHTCISRLRWNHKILNIYSPWLENVNKSFITALGIESIEEQHDG